MALTIKQLDALEAAIASGHKRVTYDGKTVEYQSVEEVIKAANYVRDQLVTTGVLTASTSSRGNATLAEFSRD